MKQKVDHRCDNSGGAQAEEHDDRSSHTSCGANVNRKCHVDSLMQTTIHMSNGLMPTSGQ